MKTLRITLIAVLAIGYSQTFGQSEPVKVAQGYKIDIKTSAVCTMCKEAIEYDLAFEKGVKSATLDVPSKVVTVVYNPKKTDANKIRKRITKVGYHADNLERDSMAYEKLPFCCKDGAHADENDPHH
ncbi:MAG: heavy metal-associated domain-containing protein [Bacteroidota bacterium]